jgi:hypothetical protein
MHSIKETISELIHNDNLKNNIFKPIGAIIYNEVYFYVLLILVYCGLLFLAILGSLFYLLSIYKKLRTLEERLLSHDTL